MGENTDRNKSENEHFSRSGLLPPKHEVFY